MLFGRIARFALVLLPVVVCVGRIHASRTASPDGVTREVNRCLAVVRVAASRRRADRENQERLRQADPGALAADSPPTQLTASTAQVPGETVQVSGASVQLPAANRQL